MKIKNIFKKYFRLFSYISGLYVFMSSSGFHFKKKWKKYVGVDFAHRGLHDKEKGIPENSMTAYEKAVECGYGIELDVRITADNQLVIMHDENLLRMCGVNKLITKMEMEEIKDLKLAKTDEKIPLFKDVLKLVDGKVPLLVEIKSDHFEQSLICPLVWQLLKDYKGDYIIESFNPLVVLWFRFHHPSVVRGQLSCNFFKEKAHCDLILFSVTHLLTNFMTHPDFISYKYIDTLNPAYQLNKHLFHAMTAVWTIHSKKDYDKFRKKTDIRIFEGFRP